MKSIRYDESKVVQLYRWRGDGGIQPEVLIPCSFFSRMRKKFNLETVLPTLFVNMSYKMFVLKLKKMKALSHLIVSKGNYCTRTERPAILQGEIGQTFDKTLKFEQTLKERKNYSRQILGLKFILLFNKTFLRKGVSLLTFVTAQNLARWVDFNTKKSCVRKETKFEALKVVVDLALKLMKHNSDQRDALSELFFLFSSLEHFVLAKRKETILHKKNIFALVKFVWVKENTIALVYHRKSCHKMYEKIETIGRGFRRVLRPHIANNPWTIGMRSFRDCRSCKSLALEQTTYTTALSSYNLKWRKSGGFVTLLCGSDDASIRSKYVDFFTLLSKMFILSAAARKADFHIFITRFERARVDLKTQSYEFSTYNAFNYYSFSFALSRRVMAKYFACETILKGEISRNKPIHASHSVCKKHGRHISSVTSSKQKILMTKPHNSFTFVMKNTGYKSSSTVSTANARTKYNDYRSVANYAMCQKIEMMKFSMRNVLLINLQE